MTRSLLPAFLLFLLPFNTFAGKIEVAQWVPWNFLISEISAVTFDERMIYPVFDIDAGELRPRARDVNISANGRITAISINSSGISSVQEAGLSLGIDKLVIDQFIIREFNGNQIQVRLKAECSAINVEVPHFVISSRFNFLNHGDYWIPTVEQINIDIPDGSWSISPFTCTGIGGISEEITLQLKNALKRPDAFRALFHPWLGEKINQVIRAAWDTLSNSVDGGMKITSMGRPLDKGILIHGELSLTTNEAVPLPVLSENRFSDTLPQLILSSRGFEAILEDKFLSLVPKDFDLQKISAFKDLMKSRLAQYFVWPDLRRFPSSTSFFLGMDPAQTRLRLVREKNNWKAVLNSNGRIRTTIGGSMIDYIQFGIGISTPVEITLQDGQLKLSNSSVDLKMAWSYGFLYQLIYRPNNRIAVAILKNAMTDFFANQSVAQDLPAIQWRGKELKLQNWSEFNGIITMDWL